MISVTWAADEAASTEEPVTENESSASEGLMIRHESTVVGYQALDVAGQKIDATFTEETLGTQYGGVILLHDVGEEFDSAGVISSLRHSLPEHGWSTLTLALDYPFEPSLYLIEEPSDQVSPDVEGAATEMSAEANEEQAVEPKVSELEQTQSDDKLEDNNESKSDEKAALPPVSNEQRVSAALSFIEAKSIERVILLGYGGGGELAISLLGSISSIEGLVLVGATSPDDITNLIEAQNPILDLLGERDFTLVQEAAKKRKVMMKRNGNLAYQQRKVSGANHQFLGLEPTLTATINGWLLKQYIEQDDN